MKNILNINNIRINLSSYKNIYNIENILKLNTNNNYKFNNNKIININSFELKLYKKKIKYSTFYTNPHKILFKIVKNIKFEKNKNYILSNLCKILFLEKQNINDFNNLYLRQLYNLIQKKNSFFENYISIEKCFLIIWFLVYIDKNIDINIKKIYFDLILLYYLKYSLGTFNFLDIINNLINSSDIILKKFYISFYILCEEFHYKYIKKILSKDNKKKIIFFNSNYININPQNILNDFEKKFIYNTELLNEIIDIPCGHNILLIKLLNKIFYYDSDELILFDFIKFKLLFKLENLIFLNISNRIPIQTINDDINCLFYCNGFIKYLIINNIPINFNKLKNAVFIYETNILFNNNLINFIFN